MNVPKPGSAPTVVYVASARSNEISSFVLNIVDGRVEFVEHIALSPGVTPLTIDPSRRYLYAGLRDEPPSIVAFTIESGTGHLQPAGSTLLADPPMYLATDKTGKFILSASYAAATFSINAIGDDGRIDAEPRQRSHTPRRPHSIVTDPTNRYLFVASLGDDAILQYQFDATTGRAALNAVPSVKAPAGSGPRHMIFHPHGNVLYVNGELDGSICSYALASETGCLRPLHRSLMLARPNKSEPWAAELAIEPNGRYLYATERRTSSLVIFDLSGEPGALRRVDILATEEQPRSFAIDPSGQFLVLAGELSNHVRVYAINASTGALDACYRCAVGEKPTWVSIVSLPPR